MSREIKFRAFDVIKNKMIYDNFVIHPKNGLVFMGEKSHSEQGMILIQNTGLKDKHGLDVYDGDVRYGKYFSCNIETETFQVVKWDNNSASYYWETIKGDSEMPDFIGTEIIGNIYEHPHLLK